MNVCVRTKIAESRRRRQSHSRDADLRAFLIMAGHDLRSPLSVVTACLDVARDDRSVSDQGLDMMERAVRRMGVLIDGMLAHARADQAQLEPHEVSLDDIVAEVADARLAVRSDARVTVNGPLPEVHADAGLLAHVLDNLIGNALKYTPSGAEAQVSVSACVLPGGTVRVEVADRGIGVPDADRSRIFDAFHRCGNSAGYQGSGLGLAICRRIVERHGGRIGVDDNPGGGSLFWFTLPPVASR
jgi:signal transduction histidine kinase